MINEDDYYFEDYNEYNEKKWTADNIKTLVQWNCIAAYNIEVLDMSISMYQRYMRWNVIFGLIMSTTSGAISASRFSADPKSQLIITFNYIFTFMAFSIAIFTGAIKIYQVQENLEIFIRIKQEWINFSTLLVAEFQLPLSERQDAVTLIKNNKSKYLDLLKTPINIPKMIREYGEERIRQSTKKALDQRGFDMGHELVDIIYHMNTRLLYDVDNLDKYNKNGKSKSINTVTNINNIEPDRIISNIIKTSIDTNFDTGKKPIEIDNNLQISGVAINIKELKDANDANDTKDIKDNDESDSSSSSDEFVFNMDINKSDNI